MNESSNYYVYVYIDPRNFEEFYYGKGVGDRKGSHLFDESDSEKAKRIQEIQSERLEPIIRVVATNLTENEAHLVETTLIWKLGRQLTNVSPGHYAKKFRPYNTFHKELPRFDYQNEIYFVNVGEGPHRCWVDCRKYGFLSAGGGKIWGEQMKSLHVGDVAVAYLKRKGHSGGYVGIGVVTEIAVMAKDFRVNGKRLDELNLVCRGILRNANDPNKSEYPVRIDWKRDCDAQNGKWIRNKGLFAGRMAVASLKNQKATIDFVSSAFNTDLYSLLS